MKITKGLNNRKYIGKVGEDKAIDFLKTKGYEILYRNYKTKFGEIDIIATDNDYLVFVEVKRRMSLSYGTPQESITKLKQSHIIKSALSFIKQHNIKNKSIRFDVVTITGEKIDIIKNAFQTSESFYV